MRWILPMLGLLCAVPAHAAGIEFVRVWPEWAPADSFKRISEYFTGRENTGGRIIRRSQPDARGGYYFLVRVKNPGAPLTGAKFRLAVVMPSAPDPRIFEFPADVPPGSNLFDLGLTGVDWAGPKVRPVAWKLELIAADGGALLARQSFLWAMPER